MADPLDSAVMLEDASEIVQELYFDKYEEQYASRFGSTTNKCFTPDPVPVMGDGKTMQYEVGPADSVRFQIDPLGEIASPQRIDPGQIKIRWNRQNTSAHDFTQMSARVQFDLYTLENGKGGAIVDLADRIYNSVQGDFNEKLAILRHSDRTAQLALVNGTPKQNNRSTLTDSASTPTNTTGVRLAIDTGSIAVFKPNARYDFINPSTGAVRAGNLRCTDIPNYADSSVGFEFVTSGLTGELSTGNIANIADNDIIVYSGTYNSGLWSFGAWFAAPVNSATFMCGANRESSSYRWMIPQRLSAGSAPISKTLFNNLAIAMGYLGEDPQNSVVIMSGPKQHQAMRDEIGEDAFIQFPTGDERAKRFMNFGSIGLNYQHPTFGTVKIVADPLAREDRVLAIVNETWKTLSYAWKGLRPIKRAGGEHWYFLNQSTPNTGQGLIKAADWVGNIADWCTRPWKNGCIHTIAVPA